MRTEDENDSPRWPASADSEEIAVVQMFSQLGLVPYRQEKRVWNKMAYFKLPRKRPEQRTGTGLDQASEFVTGEPGTTILACPDGHLAFLPH